jgi:hypothetical protein
VAVALGSWSGRKGTESFVQPCRSRMGLPKGIGSGFGIGRGWDRLSIGVGVVLAGRNSARRQMCIKRGRYSSHVPDLGPEQRGPRRSARLGGAHRPQDSSSYPPLCRSARVTSTQRN